MKYKLVDSKKISVIGYRLSVVSFSQTAIQKIISIIHYPLSITFCLLSSALFFSCANPQPPSGGPPDKSPPLITRYAPAQGTLEFNGNSITIGFNKYMNKNTVVENIFISPSVKMKFDWSGKELEIEFDEPLQDSTTYVFSLGTEYSDLKGNKASESFSLIFSTGAYLDSGAITGTLIDASPSGTNIYAYRTDNINPDTLNPAHTRPNYRTQAGQSGKFDLVALKEGKYRIIAIRDKFKDEVYDEGLDDFGAAPFDVDVGEDSTPVLNLKIGAVKDNTRPQLFSAEGLNSNLFELIFSEPLDTNFVSSAAFELQDSTGNTKADVSGAMLSPKSSDKVWIFTATPLDTTVLWKITATNNNEFSIRDTSGNKISDSVNFAYFYAENGANQSQPEILKMPFPDSSLYVPVTPVLDFIFNLPVDKQSLLTSDENQNSFSFIDADSVKIKYDVNWKSDNILKIIPKNKLEPMKWYIINFNMGEISAVNGMKGKDTTLRLKFRIQDTRNYGGIKGKIKNLTKADSSLKIIIFNNNFRYTTFPSDSGKWSVPSISEGKYQFELFYDYDNNGKYSFGEAYPFKHSEPFILFKEEKEVPARWTIELELPAP